jgi:hypothetical protein
MAAGRRPSDGRHQSGGDSILKGRAVAEEIHNLSRFFDPHVAAQSHRDSILSSKGRPAREIAQEKRIE